MPKHANQLSLYLTLSNKVIRMYVNKWPTDINAFQLPAILKSYKLGLFVTYTDRKIPKYFNSYIVNKRQLVHCISSYLRIQWSKEKMSVCECACVWPRKRPNTWIDFNELLQHRFFGAKSRLVSLRTQLRFRPFVNR